MPQLFERDRVTVDASERSANRRRTRRPLARDPVAFAILAPASTQLVDMLPRWGTPFKQQIVDRSRAPLLLELHDLSQYQAAAGGFSALEYLFVRYSLDCPRSQGEPVLRET